MNERWLEIAYLAISSISLMTQSWKLASLISRWPVTPTEKETAQHRGLLRTSACRVLAAIIYVAVAVWTIYNQEAMTQLSLEVFAGVQLLWMLNAFADVKLWKYLRTHTTPPRNERNK